MEPVPLYWRKLIDAPDSAPVLPTKGYRGDAGFDLWTSRQVEVLPGHTINVSTDIAIAIPHGWFGLIKTRSSTLPKHGLIVMEGVIDSNYRGELFYQVYNPGNATKIVEVADRLAQIIILPVPEVIWMEVMELPMSQRGSSGFGSTGR